MVYNKSIIESKQTEDLSVLEPFFRPTHGSNAKTARCCSQQPPMRLPYRNDNSRNFNHQAVVPHPTKFAIVEVRTSSTPQARVRKPLCETRSPKPRGCALFHAEPNFSALQKFLRKRNRSRLSADLPTCEEIRKKEPADFSRQSKRPVSPH